MGKKSKAVKRLIFSTLLAGLALAEPALAARSIVAPPYPRRVVWVWPNTTPEGTPIGAIMSVMIVLTNVSQTPQTGELSLLNGTQGWAIEYLRANASVRFILCNNSSWSGVGNNSSAPSAGVPFSLGPEGSVTLQAILLMTSTYSAPGPSGHSLFDASFNPMIKITINEDRGAVNGTVIPTWDMPIPGTNHCDGTPNPSVTSTGDVSESRTGVPLLINGGRPF